MSPFAAPPAGDGGGVVGVRCASYTHARRHPLVLGRVAGWTLPVQLSLAQLSVLVGGLALLEVTRTGWGLVAPGPVEFLVLVGAPSAGAWAVRNARPEGRGPFQAFAGLAGFVCRPRGGVTVNGPARRHRRAVRGRDRVWTAATPAAGVPRRVGRGRGVGR